MSKHDAVNAQCLIGVDDLQYPLGAMVLVGENLPELANSMMFFIELCVSGRDGVAPPR